MTPYNIAVVFGPCFLRPEKYTMEDIPEYHCIKYNLVLDGLWR